jgi:aminoglycoside phosphotransferase (APT) family kinase protein
MQSAEIDAVAAALGQKVTASRTLAGGFSHETCLLTVSGDQLVARLGGSDPGIEAAVMAAARLHVPVPNVLTVVPPAGQDARPAMILEHITGTPLSEVLAADKPGGVKVMRDLGAEVGRVIAAIGAAGFERPGFFADEKLTVGEQPPWSQQLAEMAASCMADTPASRLDPATRKAWSELCAAHAPALAGVDGQARLVHADANPKNILVTRLRGGWRVDGVLDWEFSFAGSPYADVANMLRFGDGYPAGFADGFVAGFAGHQPDGSPLLRDWLYLGRVFDMFALSELVTRPEPHPVADQAAAGIRRWVKEGVPDAPRRD